MKFSSFINAYNQWMSLEKKKKKMEYLKHGVLLFLFLSWFSIPEFASCKTEFSTIRCKKIENQALLEFKNGLIMHDQNRLNSWIDGADCCTWEGIVCSNKTGHVVNLDLRNPLSFDLDMYFDDTDYFARFNLYRLRGKINPSLVNLKRLHYLDISMNNFSGTSIPEFFGSFKNLKYLNLSSSGFGGRVPQNLGNLLKLQQLHIGYAPFVSYSFQFIVGYSYSRLFVDSLSWITNLSSLKTLDLSGVYLGEAPDWLKSLNMLPSLSSLTLAGCELSTFPPLSYYNFTSLSSLNLGWNNFTSAIPFWMLNLTGMEELRLDHNNFDTTSPFHNLKSLSFLDLSSNSFNTSILDSICELKNLVDMDLSDNYFHGLLPNCIGNLTSLVSLNLEGNNLEGTVPVTIADMCNLQVLDLSLNQFFPSLIVNNPSGCILGSLKEFYFISNNFHGNLFSEVERYEKLEILKLSFNSFSGTIPSTIGRLLNLKELDISNNNFSGNVPVSLGQLSELVKLDISNNLLSGEISELHFNKFRKLKFLSVSSNPLVVRTSSEWIPPFQLESIDLASIKVGPQFPPWLKTQMQVKSLIMWNASISDTLPDWFEKIYSDIHDLDLSYNNISGKIPTFDESKTTLRVINLKSNYFTGPLLSFPSQVYELDISGNVFEGNIPVIDRSLNPSLSNLLLYNNRFTGEIPVQICELQSLTFIDLSDNQLSGTIPSCLGRLQNLLVLDLSKNSLSGEIPYTMGYLTNLHILQLQRNKLVGKLPSSFQELKELRILDLGENELKDTIPPWIEKWSMVFLRLQSNNFYGDIPKQLCHFKFIRLLNLGGNNLSGTIPHCFGNFSSMIYDPPTRQLGTKVVQYFARKIADSMKGSEREYSSVLPFLQSIKLSENKLTGNIPDEIFKLKGLKSLNLSGNYLEGRISESIGNLTQLESLDLSRNEFSGSIPLSLSKLNALSHLNLSINKLSGRIPSGNQLQTLNDPSIYSGNDGLCGIPLSKICLDDKPSTIGRRPRTERNSQQKIDFTWFYAGVGPGFGFGFLGFWSIIVFNQTFRAALFQFLDRVLNR